ncbi:nuclear transport factor 2 family protein [Altericroceibacterium xinjiangense]|uniref:nuclear transport factor 2 family protein n=1 Tax=Altericroceibacterium xinjiangense TaxID=762261 RepID=UPI0013E02715|nr:nuclear transport factor 2 family protein [Altericroceibacterium xinjiangense]
MPSPALPTYSADYAQDRAEIEDLMARYLFAMDYNDFDSYAATFTEDAELEFASGATKGRDNIRATAKSFKERIATVYTDEEGNPAILRHVLAHSAIQVEGDHAWSRSFWYEMANNGPGNSLKMGTFGIYEDELRKENGRWLFTKRRILNEFLTGRQSGPENPVLGMERAAAAAK